MISQWRQSLLYTTIGVHVPYEHVETEQEDEAEKERVFDDDARLSFRISPYLLGSLIEQWKPKTYPRIPPRNDSTIPRGTGISSSQRSVVLTLQQSIDHNCPNTGLGHSERHYDDFRSSLVQCEKKKTCLTSCT